MMTMFLKLTASLVIGYSVMSMIAVLYQENPKSLTVVLLLTLTCVSIGWATLTLAGAW